MSDRLPSWAVRAKRTTQKRVISVSVKRPKRNRAQKIRTVIIDGIGVVRLDPALLDMLRGHVEAIRKVYPDVWDVPSWDVPWTAGPLEAMACRFVHAVGFIAGAAAMMDLTPCMLIDNLGL